MYTVKHKILADELTPIYSATIIQRVNKIILVNTSAEESISFLYIRETASGSVFEDTPAMQVVITPNGLILDAGARFVEYNTVVNPQDSICVQSNKTADVVVMQWDD